MQLKVAIETVEWNPSLLKDYLESEFVKINNNTDWYVKGTLNLCQELNVTKTCLSSHLTRLAQASIEGLSGPGSFTMFKIFSGAQTPWLNE